MTPNTRIDFNFEINRAEKEVRFDLRIDQKFYNPKNFVKIADDQFSVFEKGKRAERPYHLRFYIDIPSGLRDPQMGQMMNIADEIKMVIGGENGDRFLAINALTQLIYPRSRDKTTFPLGLHLQLEYRDEEMSEFEKRLAEEHKRLTGEDNTTADSYGLIRRIELSDDFETLIPQELAAQLFSEVDKTKKAANKSVAKMVTDALSQQITPSVILKCKPEVEE